MKQQLGWWLDHVADARVPRGEREAPHLRPLPARPCDTARVIYPLCDAMGCVAWDGNLYEVPYEHVTDYLAVRITSEQVIVYGRDLRPVATHARRAKGLGERARLRVVVECTLMLACHCGARRVQPLSRAV